jgi:ABC-2 type transport system permease protein
MALGMLSLFIMQLIFLAVGIFLGCALKRHKLAASLAVSILLGTYFISVISGLKEEWGFLKYITPFKYFDPAILMRESTLDPTFVALSAGIVVVLVAGAYVSYARRDLYI